MSMVRPTEDGRGVYVRSTEGALVVRPATSNKVRVDREVRR